MEQNLLLEQRQQLQLSPRMYQSIKILQMNIIELNRWLEKETQENPVLEIVFNQADATDEDTAKRDRSSDNNESDDDSLLGYLVRWKDPIINKKIVTNEQEQEGRHLDTILNKTSLEEHLRQNFGILAKDELDYKIGEYLIGNIDYNGYLTISCKEAASDLRIPEKKVRQILALIQNCSLPGLGARNLKECLLLQLKQKKLPEKRLLKELILSHLGELSRKDFKTIGCELKLTFPEIQHLLDILKKEFNPKPGRVFSQHQETKFLVPDIIVKKIDNQYEIFENKDNLNDIKINSFYEKMLFEYQQAQKLGNQETLSQEKLLETRKTLDYLKKKISTARWILRCMEQRRNTIFKIIRFIISYQREFLEKGVIYLKPLSLEQVADALGLNKSTISRAIKSKKVQLPRGVYELKYFFSKGLPQTSDGMISNEIIKNLIRKYITEEDVICPYSDQELTEILQEKERVKVARRTVAKYRKLMDIPSARLRKRYD